MVPTNRTSAEILDTRRMKSKPTLSRPSQKQMYLVSKCSFLFMILYNTCTKIMDYIYMHDKCTPAESAHLKL